MRARHPALLLLLVVGAALTPRPTVCLRPLVGDALAKAALAGGAGASGQAGTLAGTEAAAGDDQAAWWTASGSQRVAGQAIATDVGQQLAALDQAADKESAVASSTQLDEVPVQQAADGITVPHPVAHHVTTQQQQQDAEDGDSDAVILYNSAAAAAVVAAASKQQVNEHKQDASRLFEDDFATSDDDEDASAHADSTDSDTRGTEGDEGWEGGGSGDEFELDEEEEQPVDEPLPGARALVEVAHDGSSWGQGAVRRQQKLSGGSEGVAQGDPRRLQAHEGTAPRLRAKLQSKSMLARLAALQAVGSARESVVRDPDGSKGFSSIGDDEEASQAVHVDGEDEDDDQDDDTTYPRDGSGGFSSIGGEDDGLASAYDDMEEGEDAGGSSHDVVNHHHYASYASGMV